MRFSKFTLHAGKLSRGGFSLIELLAVITIAGILAVLVFVNAPSLLQATGFTQGTRFVEDTLNFARENAVNQSVPTVAVVRITGNNAWCRMAVFSAPVSSTGTTNWVQISKWQNIPSGAIIDSTYDPSTEGWTSPTTRLSLSPVVGPATAIQDGTTALTYQTDYYAIGFLPDGSLQNTNNIAIRVVRGHIVNGVPTVDGGTANPTDWIKLIIVQVTGHVKDIRKGQ